ncbi:helix-turn-helix transcriptional regulator [Leuconostoc suionicum]|uniref:helix-turn-helix domain-containing protein n=1 Tax=Leuconostoc suionicum TaxID=1511761 RepID=UPI00233F53FE|nr:helix-turn-helix transcriptional regulator [Leuconostoc suionicum]MDC2815406.1 helix-turn-helix transcriptional regulator [Leuconostoc suionicum]
MRIGEKIKIIRENKKISQEDMAKSLHVSGQAVSNWERGKGYPDISNIIMISDLYEISLDELIREDKNYKDVLLEKKVSKIADLTINIILLIIATLAILYAYATNKINDNNNFAVIIGILIIIHTSIYLYKRLFKK